MSKDISAFPITEHLSQICDAIKASDSRALVLTAETGAGKSTILPIALLQNFSEKILMTEPRRIAVLGVANRVSDLLDEECGQSVGYKIHLESKSSAKTRLEVMTEAVLVKMLQENPELEGYNVVVLDEAHERSVNFDLALAFLREAMELRDDLYVIIMSATIDCKKLSEFFGMNNIGDAPVINIPGRTFPVEVIYDDKNPMEKVIVHELDKTEKGNILAFLPGISDIRKTEQKLMEILPSQYIEQTEICILHSSISLEQQKKILTPTAPNLRRVILSSAIAETSLTVPDIVSVIDSGFARVSKINIATGMENLVTEPESEFSAEQRKGRAGRVQKGRCIRLWNEFDARQKNPSPEILRCDLSSLVLECADRGITSLEKICWLDSPKPAQWNESVKLLLQFHFLENKANSLSITEKGRAALTLGLSPRLANLALEGYKSGLKAQTNALLLKYSEYDKSSPQIQKQFLSDLERRLSKINFEKLDSSLNNPKLLILSGFPDRLAHRISKPGDIKTEYQFAVGRKAILSDNEKHISPEWIAAPEVLAGASEARIFDFEELPAEIIPEWLKNRTEIKQICSFENGKIRKTEQCCFGQIVLSSKNLPAQSSDYAQAWIGEIKENGIEALPSDKKMENFIQRAKFYFQQNKNMSKEDFEQYLAEKAEEWLTPFVTGTNLSSQNVYDALHWFLDGQNIDKEVPEILILPNGVKTKIKYETVGSNDIRPVIEIIIQRIFGCRITPEICGTKILLRLLSPASRPLQITEDLENFWINTWPDICKEMKGRYSKHNWDSTIAPKE